MSSPAADHRSGLPPIELSGLPALSVVLPAHNEASTLPLTIARLRAVLGTESGHELLVVENGSTDETFSVARAAAAEPGTPLRALRSAPGIGAAYRTGIEAATGEIVVLSAADLPFGFTDLISWTARERAGERPRLAIGSKGHPCSHVPRGMVRRVMTATFVAVRRVLLHSRVRDTQGTFLIETDLAKQLAAPIRTPGFLFTTELVARAEAAGITPVELPVVLEPERRSSTVRPLRDGWRMVRGVWDLRRRLR
jgi:dolichyl-phosphate beta-glucosyltransferase